MHGDVWRMKKINKDILRKKLKAVRHATKPELAEQTGLSVVTVNSLITELVRKGEATEGDCIPSNGGRPSRQYHYNGDYKKAAIIFSYQKQEKTYVQYAVINLFGERREDKKECVKQISLKSFQKWLDQVCPADPAIGVIAFGLPGVEEEGRITINDHGALTGKEFLSYYQERYHLPVIFENDINAAAYGFQGMDQREQERCSVGIYFPRTYNPGAGIVYREEIYYGRHKLAGEIDGIPMPYNWLECDYQDLKKMSEMIGNTVIIYSCILAPDAIVLYGDFFTGKLESAIRSYVGERLKEKFDMKLLFKKDITDDFEAGMKRRAIEYLEMEKRR